MTMTHGKNKWTDDVIKELRSLKNLGYSASQIAGILNDVYKTEFTRSAVLGKLFRLNGGKQDET